MAKPRGGLSSTEAQRQVTQMVSFLKLEAQEKANEIKTKARQDASIELQMRLQKGKERLSDELNRLKREKEVSKRVQEADARSKQQRRLLDNRAALVDDVKKAARARLCGEDGERSFRDRNGEAYWHLMEAMVVETGVRLCPGDAAAAAEAAMGGAPPKIRVQVLPDDISELKRRLGGLQKRVNEERNKDAQARAKKFGLAASAAAVPDVSLLVDEDHPLKPETGGGVVMSLLDDSSRPTIVCDDTLTRRLDISFDNLSHIVRAALFGSVRALPEPADDHPDLFA